MELNISILSAALRGEPTGQARSFRADVAAVAKRDLRAGEKLDGEGGFTVWGRAMRAADSIRFGALPIGLAHNVRLKGNVRAGCTLRWSDVDLPDGDESIAARKEMERRFGTAR